MNVRHELYFTDKHNVFFCIDCDRQTSQSVYFPKNSTCITQFNCITRKKWFTVLLIPQEYFSFFSVLGGVPLLGKNKLLFVTYFHVEKEEKVNCCQATRKRREVCNDKRENNDTNLFFNIYRGAP